MTVAGLAFATCVVVGAYVVARRAGAVLTVAFRRAFAVSGWVAGFVRAAWKIGRAEHPDRRMAALAVAWRSARDFARVAVVVARARRASAGRVAYERTQTSDLSPNAVRGYSVRADGTAERVEDPVYAAHVAQCVARGPVGYVGPLGPRELPKA